MKRLYLLRHAKAGFDLTGQADAERVLTHSGKQDAIKLGYKLKGRNEDIDLFLCSPALRTRQTLEAIMEVTGYSDTRREWVNELYQASDEKLIQLVKAGGVQTDSCMVVGHNPSITQAANWLARDFRIDHLPTCGLLVLEFDVKAWHQLQQHSGKVLWFDFPKNEFAIL